MVTRTDIEFTAEGGIVLRGWLYVPGDGSGKHPAITMAHGFAAVKEHGLERFAEAFVQAGFVVLLHDHRNFGASDGLPRQDMALRLAAFAAARAPLRKNDIQLTWREETLWASCKRQREGLYD